MKLVTSGVFANIDPRFQRILDQMTRGVQMPASASTQAGDVAVVAKVTDLAAWEALSEVAIGSVLGKTRDGDTVVTARIPARRVQHVRTQPFVTSLKPPQRLRRSLASTVEDTAGAPSDLPNEATAGGGRGVIVGIVDYGCDFAHENFMEHGATRLRSIWNQAGTSPRDSPNGYGALYRRADINSALKKRRPYRRLGYGPARDTSYSRGSHGTHVMDIAAGNGGGSGVPGLAPEAELVFVHVSSSDLPWNSEDVVGKSFGDSVQLLEAIAFIFDEAGDTPCVVNVSLGTNGGPHDGTTLVEQGIDAIVRAQPNRAVVIAASNSYADGIHAQGEVAQGGSDSVRWTVAAGDTTSNELEVWYSGSDEFRAELVAPDGTSLGSVTLGQSGRIVDDSGDTLLFVAHRKGDPNNGDNVVGIYLETTLPAGTWTVRLHGESVTDGRYHAWIERDDRSPSSFAPPHNNTHTLGSISCGQDSIVVASYDANKVAKTLSWFSSSGPTRDGREKPEVSAPGHGVWAAHSRTKTGTVSKSGTSMAAPAVTGIVALMMSEASACGKTLSIDVIRRILRDTARPMGSGWDARYGSGRAHAAAAVQAVIDLP